jgi:tyrosine-protein kinase Etk/Wzc
VSPEGTGGARSRIAGDEAGLIDYLRTVWRYRWIIVSICGLAVGASVVITLTTPRIYESTSSLLVPKESLGVFPGLQASAVLQQFAGVAGPSLTPNRDMLVSILRSRTMAQALVDRFELQKRYRQRYAEDAVGVLQRVTLVSVSREGVISVRVEDRDPQVATQMANYYVEQLDRIVSRLDVGEAGQRRVFLTDRLAHAKADLDIAEQTFRRFQERNRAVALQDQTRDAIEAAARMKGEIMAAEVQIQVLRNFATEANPEMIALRRRVDEMKRQLAQMQYGEIVSATAGAGQDRRDFALLLPKVPAIALELARLTRDVKVQETIVTLLTQQLEQTKIAEANTMPVVRVLDRATPAERHSKPSLRVNVATAGAGSVLIAILLVFSIEFVKKLRSAWKASPAA